MDEGQNSYSETPWMKSDRDDDDDMMESRDGKETPDPVTIPICVLKTEDTTDDESDQLQIPANTSHPVPNQRISVKAEPNNSDDELDQMAWSDGKTPYPEHSQFEENATAERIQQVHQASNVQLELNSNVVSSQIKDMLSSSKTVSSFIPVSCSTCGLVLRSHREQMIHIRIHPKECDICGKPYTVMRHLMVHLKTHHSTIPYPCKFCDKGYYVRNELLSHMRCHTAEWQYRCELCMKPFFCSSGLSLHAARSHPGENHQCTICYARFTTKSDLQAHIATHKKALPFKCMFCMSAFGVQNILMRHIRRHPGEPPFTCNRCGVMCADGRESIQHAFSHGVESDSSRESLTVKCEHCDKVFPSKDELIKHSCRTNERSHPGENHQCTICYARFTTKSDLQAHIATHKKALPFKCMFCMSAFGVQNILIRHIRHHPGEPPFTCNRCGVTCADGRESIQHAFSHGVESDSSGGSLTVKCEHCDKVFPSKDELIKHSCRTNEGTKSYKCTMCPETFSEAKELENHINKIHHTVRYNPFNPKVQSELIPSCEKSIKSSHSVYPSFKCVSCSEEFAMKRDLKHHIKVTHLTKSQSSKSEVTKHIRKSAKESLTSSVEQHLNPMLEQSG